MGYLCGEGFALLSPPDAPARNLVFLGRQVGLGYPIRGGGISKQIWSGRQSGGVSSEGRQAAPTRTGWKASKSCITLEKLSNQLI